MPAADFSIRRCPKCGNTETHWRHGVHFEHERRCPKCSHCWDPDEEYQKWQQAEKERLEFNTHRD